MAPPEEELHVWMDTASWSDTASATLSVALAETVLPLRLGDVEVSVRLRRDDGRWVAEQEGAGPDTEDVVLRLRRKDLRAAVLGVNPPVRTFNVRMDDFA